MASDDLFAERYRLEGRLGVGGMSTVRLAFDTRLERYVAVKLLAEHLAQDQAFVQRFRREALAAARLVHPNVVQVFDFGLDDPSARHYIVMEYIKGQSGAEILRDQGRLEPAAALSILGQACRGLEYAHRNGVVHRDVKPGNLLRAADSGMVKLADFGIAKAAESSDITKVGSVIGTAAYLAPEQARGEPAGPAADIYALGVVAYQLLSGRLPYQAPSLTELARQQQAGLPEPLDELLPGDVSTPLAQAVEIALAAEPEARYPDPLAFEKALNEAARGIEPTAPGGGRRGEPTASTRMLDQTERTRAMPPTGADRTRARPPEPQQRRRLEPLHEDAPPPRPPVRHGAGATGDGGGARRGRNRAARAFASLLTVLVLVAAAVLGVTYLAGSSPRAVELKEDIRGDVEQSAQELLDLIRDNTR